MQTMNQSLAQLVRENHLSRDAAMEHSFMPDELAKMLPVGKG